VAEVKEEWVAVVVEEVKEEWVAVVATPSGRNSSVKFRAFGSV